MAGPVKDREAFQRLSFLYQVSRVGCAGAIAAAGPALTARRPQAAHCVLAQDPENQALARFYCHTERTIAKRLVLRRDPSVKRTLCRGCSSLLVPGLTCTQRQRRSRGQRWTVQTCLTCQRSQRFLNNPGYVLWGDRPEAQLGNQADPRPAQPLPNTAHPIPGHLPEEKVQPQSTNHQ
ncbi:ribonuclease P protein subunit p21-like isoform X1 [Talpa occidentalis]|uniref:ribonuclease P protein subunit p21-like isoform X1 n=1 Tax=Talpa occidentalis TaxID=50954 RepID=UPI00188F21B9|nr:ribonuclease P protein subunit p21-like isoform X1 [Talpa occidentalis]